MDNKLAGLIGIITLLASFGGLIYLTPDQQNSAYTCSTTNQVYLCDSLSSTSKTCYWTLDGVKKSAVCTNGVFTKTIFGPVEAPPTGIQYLCNQFNCTRIR